MKQHGMTLVELIMVIATITILLGVAIPSYSYLLNNARLVMLSNGMVRALNLARSEAIKRNVRVTLCKTSLANNATPVCDPAAEWHQGWLIFVDQGVVGVLDGSDEVVAAHAHPPVGASVTTSNFSSFASFLPSGISQGTNHLPNGTFHICLAGEEHRVILNNAGRIRTSRAAC
ncbi:MAG: GspH/FimT family pseudopilin [Thiobacillaceae bacterium]|jgi:type IV fimbrial biogenesis protein FimT